VSDTSSARPSASTHLGLSLWATRGSLAALGGVQAGRRDEKDVVVAEPGMSTPMKLGPVVPTGVASQLRFLVRRAWDRLDQPVYYSKNTALTFEDNGELRAQT
jgi:hypothetical protein